MIFCSTRDVMVVHLHHDLAEGVARVTNGPAKTTPLKDATPRRAHYRARHGRPKFLAIRWSFLTLTLQSLHAADDPILMCR